MTAIPDFLINIPCEKTTPLLHQYVDGEMRAPDRKRIEAHLSSCEECQSYVTALRLEEDALNQCTVGKQCDWDKLWDDRLQSKLAVEHVYLIGMELFHWLVARILDQASPLAGDSRKHEALVAHFQGALPTTEKTEVQARAALEEILRRSRFRFPQENQLRNTIHQGNTASALHLYQCVASDDAPAVLWSLIVGNLCCGQIIKAKELLENLWDTPPMLRRILTAWIEGEARPLPWNLQD